MSFIYTSAAKFAETIKVWHYFPGRKPVPMYPNSPAPGNPNFAPSMPPVPVPKLNINITTAGSLVVAIEEYQEIMWKVRPTAWPSMPHDPKEIQNMKFHMTGILQTLRCIIPDELHEVPGPMKETIDCLAQSLIRLESINTDIRGKYQSFNQASHFTQKNLYVDILDLTNMKLRQLKDMAIGDTFSSSIEDREAKTAATMIIESTAVNGQNAQSATITDAPGLKPRRERRAAQLAAKPAAQNIEGSAAKNTPLFQLPSVFGSAPSSPLSESGFNIPGFATANTSLGLPADVPVLPKSVAKKPYVPVSENSSALPITIGPPSNSPGHVAIREATSEYRNEKRKRQERQSKLRMRRGCKAGGGAANPRAKYNRQPPARNREPAINVSPATEHIEDFGPGSANPETSHLEPVKPEHLQPQTFYPDINTRIENFRMPILPPVHSIQTAAVAPPPKRVGKINLLRKMAKNRNRRF